MRNLFVLSMSVICTLMLCGGFVSAEPTIVVDPINKTITVVDDEETHGSGVDATNTSTEDDNQTQIEESVVIDESISEETEEAEQSSPTILSEFDSALSWMYAQGLTKYASSEAYRPQNNLTREQFAKMVRQFYLAMGYPTETKNTHCDFSDIEGADPTLIPHIRETCRLGIFRGSNGLFMPFNSISKAEVLAVLLRIYNQSKADETLQPRWKAYYDQSLTLGLTDESEGVMVGAADRETIALYIWRLRQQILSDKGSVDVAPQAIDKDDESNMSNGIQTGTDTLSLDRDAVLMEAIHSMYEDDMIYFDERDDAVLYQKITRADVALILDRFGALYVSDYGHRDVPASCDFTDIRNLSEEVQQSIKNLCAMNVMKGDSVSGNFFPTQSLTKAQFVTTVVRMIDGLLDETGTPWWQSYYERALSWKIITSQDRASFERQMSMIEVIGFMHRLKIHALLGASSSSQQVLSNEFVRVIESADGTTKAYIDSNFLRDIDTKVGYLMLDNDRRYKVVRDHIEEYTNTRLARYGSLIDPITDEVEGSVWFITQKGHVIQGTIRLYAEDQYYTITPDDDSYYWYDIVKNAR